MLEVWTCFSRGRVHPTEVPFHYILFWVSCYATHRYDISNGIKTLKCMFYKRSLSRWQSHWLLELLTVLPYFCWGRQWWHPSASERHSSFFWHCPQCPWCPQLEWRTRKHQGASSLQLMGGKRRKKGFTTISSSKQMTHTISFLACHEHNLWNVGRFLILSDWGRSLCGKIEAPDISGSLSWKKRSVYKWCVSSIDWHFEPNQFSDGSHLLGNGEGCCWAIKASSQHGCSGRREIWPRGWPKNPSK